MLFGGSNSVMTFGLRSGLQSVFGENNVLELAIGATSSLQNLDALIEYKQEVRKSDIVFTESNVNDSFAAHTLGVTVDFICGQIDAFYHELFYVNANVCCILIPLNFELDVVESKEVSAAINQRHIFNCNKYGFDYLDMDARLQRFVKNHPKFTLKTLVPDPRHPKIILMHDVAESLANYYLGKPPVENFNFVETHNFVRLTADSIAKELESMENSRFKAKVLTIDQKFTIPGHENYVICGISTWGQGKLYISTSDSDVVKPFNDLLSFSELTTPVKIDLQTSLEPTDLPPTEKSVGVKKFHHHGSVRFISMLLENPVKYREQKVTPYKKSVNLNSLKIIPKLEKYARDSDLIQSNMENSLNLMQTAQYLLNGEIKLLQKEQSILKFECTGNSPMITLKGVRAKSPNRYILLIELVSSAHSTFKLFCSSASQANERSGFTVSLGKNLLSFVLDDPELNGTMYIEPLQCRGIVQFTKMNLYDIQ